MLPVAVIHYSGDAVLPFTVTFQLEGVQITTEHASRESAEDLCRSLLGEDTVFVDETPKQS